MSESCGSLQARFGAKLLLLQSIVLIQLGRPFGQSQSHPHFSMELSLSRYKHEADANHGIGVFCSVDRFMPAGAQCKAMLSLVSVLFLLCLAFAEHVVGQGTIGFGNKRSELTPVIDGDIEFVQCEFCKLAAKHLHRSVVLMKAAMPSWVKKLPEEAIDAFLDRVCNTNNETGEWLTMLDVQQQGDALVIERRSEVC